MASETDYGSALRPPTRRRSRPALSQEIVVAAALRILDAEGEPALTFRRLAGELGVGVASLYWHVESREVLLDLALDSMAGDLFAELSVRGLHPGEWRADLRFACVRMYDAFQAHPWAAAQQLVSRDRGANQLRIWDHFGRILMGAGFGDRESFYGMSAALSFTLGYAVQNVSNERTGISREDHLAAMGRFMASLDPQEFPALARGIDVFVNHDEKTQFEAGLDLILDGLADQLAAKKARPARRPRKPSA
jgi:AcrR family transcriptional regulator